MLVVLLVNWRFWKGGLLSGLPDVREENASARMRVRSLVKSMVVLEELGVVMRRVEGRMRFWGAGIRCDRCSGVQNKQCLKG